MSAVGFEPTPCYRMRPERTALDHSAKLTIKQVPNPLAFQRCLIAGAMEEGWVMEAGWVMEEEWAMEV